MATKQQLISDIELQLLQSAPSDDSELSKSQIAFWLSYELNGLVATECNEKLKRFEQIPSVYIKVANCQVPVTEDLPCGDDCADRIFVTLQAEVLTLNNDGGIVVIETDQRQQVHKASVQTLTLFNKMRFSKPSDENLIFYRVGNKIYIEGIKKPDIPFEELHVWYVPKQDVLSMANTDEVLASDLVLPELMNRVVQRGKLELYGTDADQENDGVDYKQPSYHLNIANPSEQQQ